MIKKKKNLNVVVIIIFTIFILVIGIFIGRSSMQSTASNKKPIYWIDPMEPTVHYPGPGQSRMGMELVPVYPDDDQGEQSGIRISSTVINNLGVRTKAVKKGALTRYIETVGYIEPNENKIHHIHSYVDGWVKNLFVNTIGAPVKKDQLLLQLYSPMLINAQEEYLIAVDSKDQDLVKASIKKLQALHMSDEQIKKLINTKKTNQLIDFVSPQNGVVSELNIREGMKVTPELEIMSLVDLSSIWMIAQVYEDQASFVKIGGTAEAKISAYPDKVWKGEVEYIYPQVEEKTRTLKVRFRFNNLDGILKPNMYANISILSNPKSDVLSIPLEALIRSSQGDRVVISLGRGRFAVRSVLSGMEAGDQVEILSGLQENELVVASGQFLIDSEASLKASLDRIAEPVQQGSTVPTNIEGKGVIKTINADKNSVTLQHEPIAALNWPQMTMSFAVEKGIDLSKFNEKDNIKFQLKKTKNNEYVITDIKK